MSEKEKKLAHLQEIANRGLQDKLPPKKKAVFDEAVRRGLITLPSAEPEQTAEQDGIMDVLTGSPLRGVTDFAGDMAVDGAKFIASGLAGAASLPFVGPQKAAEVVENVQNWQHPGEHDNSTSQALKGQWDAGMQKMADAGNYVAGSAVGAGALASGQGLDAAAQQSDQVQQEGIVRFTEDALLNAGAPPSVVALVKGGLAAGLAGLGARGAMKQEPTRFNQRTGQVEVDPYGRKLEPSKQEIRQKLERNSTDKDTARYELTPNDPGWSGNPDRVIGLEDMSMVKNKNAISLIDEGFDQQMIPPMRELSSSADIEGMRRQTKIAQNMKNNGISEITESPLDVLGEMAEQRFYFLDKKLGQAGRQVDKEAQKLRSERVDFTPAVNNFEQALEALDIKILRDNDYRLDFSNSILDGELLTGSRKAIMDIVNQMKKPKGMPTAWQVHNLKKALDEILNWGAAKGKDGFAGRAERIAKGLRKDLDTILDDQFPSYDKANTDYAKLRTAMDKFETIAGKKWDINSSTSNKQIGLQMRKLGSNYAAKHPIMDALTVIEKTANEFGGSFKENLILQAMFANKLNKRFRLDGDNTFKALTTQADLDAFSKAGLVEKGIETAAKKIMRRDDETAFQALFRYLDDIEGKK